MENNAQPQPPPPPLPPPLHPLLIHNLELPDEASINMTIVTSFPLSIITISDGIILYLTVTNNSITINNNLGAQDDNNNGPAQLHQLHVHDGAEILLHPLQLHALTLNPNLPTLPSFVTINNNGNRNFELLVAEDNTIYLIDPAPRVPPPDNGNGDNHGILNQPITLPFMVTLLFNNANPNNTIVAIIINVTDQSTFISAYSQLGITDWAAILDFVPAAPQP